MCRLFWEFSRNIEEFFDDILSTFELNFRNFEHISVKMSEIWLHFSRIVGILSKFELNFRKFEHISVKIWKIWIHFSRII